MFVVYALHISMTFEPTGGMCASLLVDVAHAFKRSTMCNKV